MINKIKKIITISSVGVLIFSSVAFAQDTPVATPADSSSVGAAPTADTSDAAVADATVIVETLQNDNAQEDLTPAVVESLGLNTVDQAALSDALGAAGVSLEDTNALLDKVSAISEAIDNVGVEGANGVAFNLQNSLEAMISDPTVSDLGSAAADLVGKSLSEVVSPETLNAVVSNAADAASQDVTGDLTSQNDATVSEDAGIAPDQQAPADTTVPAATDNDSGAPASDNSDNSGPTSYNSENEPYLAAVFRTKERAFTNRNRSVYKKNKSVSEADYCRDYLLGNVRSTVGSGNSRRLSGPSNSFRGAQRNYKR